ncbi:MAG: hypothetical protein ACN2B6_04585 [Rickettsiales bacterium]
MSDSDQDMMQDLPHYRSKYEEAKKVHVYFIPAFDEKRKKDIYYYAIASAMLHEATLKCLQKGYIPDFAVVVEKGDGLPPSDETKEKIKSYYGFDHTLYEQKLIQG